ncbi:MAG: T9SS type A sorting domain-containing protein [Saprospiraceae bacterium]
MKHILSSLTFCLVATLLSAQPSIEWQKTFGGSNEEEASSIQQTSDGGCIVAGYTHSAVPGHHGDADIWALKLSSLGVVEWQKALGGSSTDFNLCIRQSNDGGYIISGYTWSNDGDVSNNHGESDCWVVKLSPESLDVKDITTNEVLKIFPNPANDKVFLTAPSEEPALTVCISDAQGRQVSHQTINNRESIDVSQLANGVYSIVAITLLGTVFSSKLNVSK